MRCIDEQDQRAYGAVRKSYILFEGSIIIRMRSSINKSWAMQDADGKELPSARQNISNYSRAHRSLHDTKENSSFHKGGNALLYDCC